MDLDRNAGAAARRLVTGATEPRGVAGVTSTKTWSLGA